MLVCDICKCSTESACLTIISFGAGKETRYLTCRNCAKEIDNLIKEKIK